MGCSISKTMRITSKDENTAVKCYYKERLPSAISKTHVLREIRVILREKVLTTTTTPSILTSYITTENPASSELFLTLLFIIPCIAIQSLV